MLNGSETAKYYREYIVIKDMIVRRRDAVNLISFIRVLKERYPGGVTASYLYRLRVMIGWAKLAYSSDADRLGVYLRFYLQNDPEWGIEESLVLSRSKTMVKQWKLIKKQQRLNPIDLGK